MTLETATRRFVRQMQADGKSPLTIDVYVRELRRFAAWRGAKTDIRRVTPATIARYFTDPAPLVRADGAAKNKRTVNRAKTAVRMLFEFLELSGTIGANPARLIRSARTDRPIIQVMNVAEQGWFVAALDTGATCRVGRRDRVLFNLLLKSGMRLGAALNVDVEDLDLDARSLVTEGKHARIQRVVFPGDVAEMVREHLRAEGIRDGAVFLGRSGRLSCRQAQYRFRTVLEAAKVARACTVHSLRHAFARARDPLDLPGALGHRNSHATRHYVEHGIGHSKFGCKSFN